MTEQVILDEALVKRAQDGDLKAFEMLVVKYQFRVARLLSRYINRPTEIEDVSQEVFIKAFRALRNFRGDSVFYTWLYRIAVNTAKNHLSYKQRRKGEYDFDPQNDEGSAIELTKLTENSTPESIFASKELLVILQETIEKMPVDLKETILLREINGLSYLQISQAMACPVGTVRSRIFRAREILDDVLIVHQQNGKLK